MNNINGLQNKLNAARMQQAKAQDAKLQARKQRMKPSAENSGQADKVEISQEAKKLASAQNIYRRFLEQKAEEVKENGPERVRRIKEEMAKTDGNNLPMDEVASKIAEEMFGA